MIIARIIVRGVRSHYALTESPALRLAVKARLMSMLPKEV